MKTADNRQRVIFLQFVYGRKKIFQPLGLIHILGPVSGQEKILILAHFILLKGRFALYLRPEMIDYLIYRIADNKNTFAVYALADKIPAAALGIGHEHTAGMINHPAVYLLRHPVIITAVSRLQVIDLNTEALGNQA